MQELFDPARHEALTVQTWSPDLAHRAIERVCAAAEDEFDELEGSWLLHPADDPAQPGARSLNLYWGATGVVWALRHLATVGAVGLQRDYTRWIERYPEGVREEAAGEQHGSASYLFGESSALLLAWLQTGSNEFADRLYAVVQGNLHNAALEPLWGNSGTVLAAIRMAEAGNNGDRWGHLVSRCLDALNQAIVIDPEIGTSVWQQDLYGSRTRYLGAGHGLAGNAFALLRGAGHVDASLPRSVEQGVLETLAATALHARLDAADDDAEAALINWHVMVDKEPVAAWRAMGGRPLVQDCHGAPGIVSRLAGVPRSAPWDQLLRAAGELTWQAGPLAKGPSLCHGTAGSAMACLKLWRRFADPVWLERARLLALHAAEQVEVARARHGQGRHSLWTGDLGVACVLWNCILGEDRFPTLDHF
jgi:Lanthionine synthetase C-like protein